MVLTMKEAGLRTKHKAMVNMLVLMEQFIKANGIKTNNMEQERRNSKMALLTREHFKTV